MHILIAPDSFKGSLGAPEVAQALKEGFAVALPQATFDLLPLGDGGEGTMAILAQAKGFKKTEKQVTGPWGQDFMLTYYHKQETALLEMADLVGLASIPQAKRKPLELQTRGLGELIRFLASQGFKKLYLGLGGSATNDGGLGLAAGLGYEFFDQDQELLPAIGASLGKVAFISDQKVPASIKNLQISVLTDVTNPLCGPKGATFVFAGQKGLSESQFREVDQAMENFYQMANPAIFSVAGAGAGGGLAAALVTFAGGQIVSGIDTCLDLLGFDQRVAVADLVIVGEGRLDRQSLAGKTPIGVARRTPQGTPVIAICGSLAADLPSFPLENIVAAFPIIPDLGNEAATFAASQQNLIRTARNIGNLLHLGSIK
ncbi:glycerate kinase [Streptococcus oricebi]|uniref:Glycerate kinase n=1 Tax=Streptococcus oricebi TaxID=1547447 RepID=A0ABS5B111_9STRE|nr:glycerate kinase [Streptococcus oricebi]MBP2622516.1 glycerate kinase [Streptococcus oricebi]